MRLAEKIVNDSNGLAETLRLMQLMYLENSANHFFSDWTFKTFGTPSNKLELYKKVWEYVVKNFQYSDDPADEMLISPKYIITEKRGDCDDFALFIKTVLALYGIQSNFLLAGKTPEGFTHVAVITPDGYILDGTNNEFNILSSDYKFREIVK